MANMSYIIFICITVPMLFLLPIIRDKFARTVVAYMIVGLFCCLFVSEVNAILLEAFDSDYGFVTTNVTPVTEEVVKALPILFYAYALDNSRERLLSVAFAVGIGFAVIENMVILLQNVSSVSLLWALVRGFGSALMHGMCTGAVGLGLHFVHQKKKLFIPGTFALLVTAITYHSIYNMLVQSEWRYCGFLLPLATFAVLIGFMLRAGRVGKGARTVGESA